MKKKDVLLVLVVILIPIVLLGALAVMGADNIKPSVSFEGDEEAYTVYEYPFKTDSDGNITMVNVTDGIETKKHTNVQFVIIVNEGYTGTPVVTADGETLTPSGSAEYPYVYTVLVDEEPVTISVSGLTASA